MKYYRDCHNAIILYLFPVVILSGCGKYPSPRTRDTPVGEQIVFIVEAKQNKCYRE